MGNKRNVFVAAAVAVVVVVAIAAVVVLARGRDDGKDEGAAPPTVSTTTTSTTTTSTLPTLSGEVDLGDGVKVVVPDGALAPGATFAADQVDVQDELEGLVVPTGPVVDITLDGDQYAPVDVVFPFTAPDDPDDVLEGDTAALSFALVDHGSGWEPAPLDVDEGEGTATVEASEFSRFGGFSWSPSSFTNIVTGIFEELTGGLYTNVDEPSCDGESDRVRGPADEASPLLWCSEEADDGTATLKVANRRRYAVSLSWSDTLTPHRDAPGGLAEQFSEALPGGIWVLPPGKQVSFTAPPGAEGTVDAAYDGVANTLTTLLVAIDIVVAVVGAAPFLRNVDATGVENAIAGAACVSDILEDLGATVGTYVQVLTGCFDADLLGPLLGSVGAAVVAPLITLLATGSFFVGAWQSFFDVLNGSDQGRFTFTAEPVEPEGPPSGGGSPGGPGGSGGWPTRDDEGRPAYFAWLGAHFFFPLWTSCTEAYCIAGDGLEVLLTQQRPLRNVGTVPQASDPVSALTGLGLPAAEVTALLAPG